MLIRSKRSWELPESAATPEDIYLNRRSILKGLAGTAAAGGLAGIAGPAFAQADRAAMEAPRNEAFTIDRDLTPEDINIEYNNFYEFGSHKRIFSAAESQLRPRPWTVEIDGMCANPQTLDIDDLIAKMTLEERLYRHRCVEAWSMTVPWIGFPLRKLVEMAEPDSGAKFVRFETFNDPDMAEGIKSQPWYPWPYVEGLTMAEAMNDLPLMVVGAYGKQVANSMGAPLRLHLPWKYGFKSLKSIVRISFVDKQPLGFWEEIALTSRSMEYGFYANVNPDVPHKRWSQATERVLHTDERVPTLLFNGYAEEVAGLYDGVPEDLLYF